MSLSKKVKQAGKNLALAATLAISGASLANAATHITVHFNNGTCATGETSVYIGKNTYVIPTRDGKGTKTVSFTANELKEADLRKAGYTKAEIQDIVKRFNAAKANGGNLPQEVRTVTKNKVAPQWTAGMNQLADQLIRQNPSITGVKWSAVNTNDKEATGDISISGIRGSGKFTGCTRVSFQGNTEGAKKILNTFNFPSLAIKTRTQKPEVGEIAKKTDFTNDNNFSTAANAQTVDLSRGRLGGMCLAFSNVGNYSGLLQKARVGIDKTIRNGVIKYKGQAKKQVSALENAVKQSGGRSERVHVNGAKKLGKVWNVNQAGCKEVAQQTGKDTLYMNFKPGKKGDALVNSSPRVFQGGTGRTLAR